MAMWWTQWPTSAVGVWDVFGAETLIDGFPRGAAVVGAKGSGGGDGDVDALRVAGVEDDGVEAHASCSGLPVGA